MIRAEGRVRGHGDCVAGPGAGVGAGARYCAGPADGTEVPVEVGEGVQVLIPSAVSCQGSDRLEVYPGAVLAEPGSVVNATIKVFFKHAQPCPYSDWSVSYEVSGDIEVVSDDGGGLADAKTYVRELSVRVDGNGTLMVVYDYGTCPEGDKGS